MQAKTTNAKLYIIQDKWYQPPATHFRINQYRTHSSTYKTVYTAACKTYHTVTVYTAVFLKMNPRFRNM